MFVCLLSRTKPIAQDVANYIGRFRAIWVGHRGAHDREVMQGSLRAGSYTASRRGSHKSQQGLEAWEWLDRKASNQHEAVDVALYSIQGLPNSCKKKA